MPRILTGDIAQYENKEAQISGWIHNRRDHGKLIFLDLRDKSGILQIVVSKEVAPAYAVAENLRSEWVVEIKGTISRRPPHLCNPEIATGDFEMKASEIKVLSKAETLPFSVTSDGYETGEDLRLKYRYLDIRRERVAKILRLRHQIKQASRVFLTARGFTEVDTPILTKSTPEGARDFLVPSRHYPGSFYALPQSPQQYKQLLMVGGIEKYYQFARAFRDEDLRGDRLFEFDQLDIEMSFVNEEDIFSLTEELLIYLTEEVAGKKIQTKPFPRVTYKEAMEKYGNDKPDLRKDKNDPSLMAYVWVTEFPMFEKKEDGSWGTAHHPFTAMHEDDLPKLSAPEKLGDIRARQYDLALNGAEVFGGSIRTTDPEILTRVFTALGHKKKDIEERFGHLLEAFSYGVPPHGGIAGFDRWLFVLLNEKSIREVIPFPTTGSGRTSVMEAPNSVDEAQLRELHLKIIKERKNPKKQGL